MKFSIRDLLLMKQNPQLPHPPRWFFIGVWVVQLFLMVVILVQDGMQGRFFPSHIYWFGVIVSIGLVYALACRYFLPNSSAPAPNPPKP